MGVRGLVFNLFIHAPKVTAMEGFAKRETVFFIRLTLFASHDFIAALESRTLDRRMGTDE
jgi:hypothetical protein